MSYLVNYGGELSIHSYICPFSFEGVYTSVNSNCHMHIRNIYVLFVTHRTHLTRDDVFTHMSALTAMSFLTLDYRRAFSDDTYDSNTVSDIAIESTVELSLKFTETELRMYLGKLFEWKDLSVHDEDKYPNARSVVFYQLLSKLGGTVDTHTHLHIYISYSSDTYHFC